MTKELELVQPAIKYYEDNTRQYTYQYKYKLYSLFPLDKDIDPKIKEYYRQWFDSMAANRIMDKMIKDHIDIINNDYIKTNPKIRGLSVTNVTFDEVCEVDPEVLRTIEEGLHE